MKTSLATLCALLVTAVAFGEAPDKDRSLAGKDATIRDGSGRVAGSATTTGKSTTYRDGSGRITGTAQQGSGKGSQTFRDGSGRITGSASTTGNSTTYRDGSGRVAGTASTSSNRRRSPPAPRFVRRLARV